MPEELTETQRQIELERTVSLHFKTPDILHYALEDFDETVRDEVKEKLEMWVEYGECVTIDIDMKNNTATVRSLVPL
jgi:hypothetical protein